MSTNGAGLTALVVDDELPALSDLGYLLGRDDRVGEVGLDLTGDHVADHDATRPAVDDDEVEHLVPGMHLESARGDLTLQGLVRADEQLLPRLAPRVEGAGDLHPAERAVVEQPAVLAGEGHALGDPPQLCYV